MGHVRFVVLEGTCVSQAALAALPASSQADSTNDASHFSFQPSCNNFRFQRPVSTSSRIASVHLKSPWTSHAPPDAATPPQICAFVSSPCAPPLAFATRPPRNEPGSSLSPHLAYEPFQAGVDSTQALSGSARPSGSCPDNQPALVADAPTTTIADSALSVANTCTSTLQRMALLQLLGPSTSPAHVTGYSIMAGLTSALVQLADPWPHSPHPMQPQEHQAHLDDPRPLLLPRQSPELSRGYHASLELLHTGSSSRDCSSGGDSRGSRGVDLQRRLPTGAGDAITTPALPALRSFLPSRHSTEEGSPELLSPLQLHAACLASVAAALVRLPQVWYEHGSGGAQVPGLLGMLRLHRLPRADGVAPGPVAHQQQRLAVQPAPPLHGGGVGVVEERAARAGADLGRGGCAVAAAATTHAVFVQTSPVAGAGGQQGLSSLAEAAEVLSGSGRGGDSVAAVGGAAVAATMDGTGLRQQQQQQPSEAERPKVLENPIRYLKLLFAGAMSAVVSRTCVAPLERVKMDLLLRSGSRDAVSTALQVLRTEGIAGFWKGNALNVLRTAPFKAVNFFSFDMYHTALLALRGADGNLERFTAGACAGVTATLVCFPLDLVRTRLLASVAGPRYGNGPFSTLVGILRNEGAAALYTGCLPAVIGMAPAGAVFYGVYDMLKHRHLESLAADAQLPADPGAPVAAEAPQLTIAPVYTLLYGAMAGAASELIVYPLEVIRRKMQLQSMALAGMRQVGAAAAAAAGAAVHHHSTHHVAAVAAAAVGMAAPAGTAATAGAVVAASTTTMAAAATAAAGAASASAGAVTAAGMSTATATAAAAAAGTSSSIAAPAATATAAAVAAAHHGATTTAAAGASAAAGGVLAAAAAAHHLKPQLLMPQPLPHKALMTLSAAALANSPGLARVAAAVTAILKADGPRGFYSGLLPNMLQVLPSAALSYYTYDTLKTVLSAR